MVDSKFYEDEKEAEALIQPKIKDYLDKDGGIKIDDFNLLVTEIAVEFGAQQPPSFDEINLAFGSDAGGKDPSYITKDELTALYKNIFKAIQNKLDGL